MEPPRLKYHLVTVPDNAATGQDCRTWRKFHRVSCARVAKKMGVSTTYLSYMERGINGWTDNRVTEFVFAVKAAKKKGSAAA